MKDNNKLIAEFMGATLEGGNDIYKIPYPDKGMAPFRCLSLNLEYDKSWDWLMPVIQKIYEVSDDDNELPLIVRDGLADANFDHTYQAVTEFIEWFNTKALKS